MSPAEQSPETQHRCRERDRLIALGRRSDSGERCTLLVINEADGSWCPVIRFLQSMADHDTHHGEVVRPDGTVAAGCGVEFEPLLLPLGSLALRGGPADPRQVRPQCVGGA